VQIRGGHGSEAPESTPAGFCVFLSDPELESNIYEKPDPDSFFIVDTSGSHCGLYTCYCLKTLLNFGCIDGSQSLNRSWIPKLENFSAPDLDPDWKSLEPERSPSLKLWLRPPLMQTW